MINGLYNRENAVKRAARAVALAAYLSAKSALEIRSPSKKFEELGRFAVEGFSKGIERTTGVVTRSVTGLGTTLMSTLSGVLDGIDDEPTIRPVLDLSDVRSGVKTIQGMVVGTGSSYGLALATGSSFDSSSNNQNGLSSDSRIDKSSHTTNNTFHIHGKNPKEVANEVSKILQQDVDRRKAAWGS